MKASGYMYRENMYIEDLYRQAYACMLRYPFRLFNEENYMPRVNRDHLKKGTCAECGAVVPFFHKRQRFCSAHCRDDYWNRRRTKPRELVGRDLFECESVAA